MLYKLILSLPFMLPRMVQDMFTADTTLIFANVHMTRVPMKFNGVMQRQDVGGWYYATVPGVCGINITIGTMGAVIGFAIFCDENAMSDPQTFLDIFEQKYFSILKRCEIDESEDSKKKLDSST